MKVNIFIFFLLGSLLLSVSFADTSAKGDWLIDPAPYKASVGKRAEGKELVLSNGLVERVFRI